MLHALSIVFALAAQPPAQPAATSAEPAAIEAWTPASAPTSEPAPAPMPTGLPAPLPVPIAEPAAPAPAAPAPAPAPEEKSDKPKRAPAVGKTETTTKNAKLGDETEVATSRYKIGKGFTVATKDGRFSLQIRGRIQFRDTVDHPNVEEQETNNTLEIRRARLSFQGNVFSPYVKYYIQFGFSPRDMLNDLPDESGSMRRNPLRDFRVEFDRLRDFTIWAGQMKVPFSRQRVISAAYTNMVDRSIVNAEFNLDRDLGLMAMSKDLGGLGHKLAYYAGVFMGEGRNAFQASDFGLLYVGRFEVLPFGKFEDYQEGDIQRSQKPGLSIAGAYAFQDRAHAARGVVGNYPLDLGTTNFHHLNADILFKWHGFSFQSAFHLRKGFNRKNGGGLDDMGVPIPTVAARSGVAWYAQAGMMLPKIPLEVVGRYGLIRNTYGANSSMIDADEAGGGINWYIVGHDLKLQLDYHRLWDRSMGATYADSAKHGLDRIRLQLQLFF